MSKICAISDIHGDLTLIHKLKIYIEENNISDCILMGDYSGTIGSMDENRDDIKTIVSTIGDLANLYGIPGNCDALDTVKILRSFGIYYHNRSIRIGDYTAVFYGGSNKTPFGTPWEVEEDVIFSDLDKLFRENAEGRHLLVVHAPPKDTKCDAIPGVHAGSESIRKIIDTYAPEIVLCSHIHECAGVLDSIGKTTIINVGMFGEGNFVQVTAEGATHGKL